MILLPAIDLQEGKVVRLRRGDFSGKVVYSEEPIAVAKEWERQGAQWMHLVDLDGAMTGEYRNLPLIGKICQAVGCAVEIGGGIRTREGIQKGLAQGASRIILGTRAAQEGSFLKKMIHEFGKKIAVAVDTQQGKLVTHGWTKTTSIEVIDFVSRLEKLGVELMVVTDVNKDGMLLGPNLELMESVLKTVHCQVIASGGVSSLQDLIDLRKLSLRYPCLQGVIIGKALYEGKFTLKEALDSVD